MHRVPRSFLFALIALMSLALVGNPLAGSAQAAPLPQQQEMQDNGGGSDVAEGTDPVWGEANWRLAARFAPYNMEELVYSTSVRPNWIEGTDNFWYEYETAEGSEFILVEPAQGRKRPIFDNDRIAAELTRITKDPYDGKHLPITSIRFIDPDTIQFDVESSQDAPPTPEAEQEDDMEEEQQEERRQGRERPEKLVHHFEFDISTQTLRELDDYEEPDDHPGWASVSPDLQWVVFGKDYNLYMMSYEDYQRIVDARRGKDGEEAEEAEEEVEVEEIQLTDDGVEHYSYHGGFRGQTDNEKEEEKGKRQRAGITWAHDGSRFAMTRSDEREVGDLWVVHVVGNDRPELESYKYEMPGEENVPQAELLVFDMADREMNKVEGANIWKDQRLRVYSERQFFYPDSDEPRISKWLSSDPDELYYWRRSRDQHRVDVVRYNPSTGEHTVVIEERLNTYVEDQQPELLDNGDLIWWSERDGWAHLYRIAPDGTEVGRLTEGPWAVRRLLGVDQNAGESGLAFFIGNAREEGEDPYYNHLYRVGLDGSDMRLLNPGNFDHLVTAGESVRYFVDNFSRVDTTPNAVVIDRDGEILVDLEEADLSKLMEAGYEFPQPFGVKSADGVTDIYGVIYRPFDFDPTKKYPIVAYVYPGPQTESVAKAFRTSPTEVAMAQLGMIVITIGNRGGNPARSKWYHNYGYGDLRDYGLADKKSGIEQLAQRHPWIDIDRVGIYGHSGGGFMSTAAMLVYPDFFDVAVSSSGNHNNDVYNQNWSEKHDGVKEVVDEDGNVTFEYDIETNSDLAANLKGHLLLTTGDVDNNVHHAGTFRMAEALIRANKRFDMFVFPGQRHGYRGPAGDYWFWLRAEYFARHLLGAEREEIDVTELNNEQPQAGGRGVTRRTNGNGNGDGGRGGGR